MTTKKDVIIKKFLQYECDIKTIVNTSIIPSLEDIDVLDFYCILIYTSITNKINRRQSYI